jgi:hypothetical protein
MKTFLKFVRPLHDAAGRQVWTTVKIAVARVSTCGFWMGSAGPLSIMSDVRTWGIGIEQASEIGNPIRGTGCMRTFLSAIVFLQNLLKFSMIPSMVPRQEMIFRTCQFSCFHSDTC